MFYGVLLISDDTRYAVHQATLNIGKTANINWINDVQIDLGYSEFKNGSMLPVHTDLKMLIGGSKSDVLYGRRETQYLGHRTDSISNENFVGVPVEKKVPAAVCNKSPNSSSQTYTTKQGRIGSLSESRLRSKHAFFQSVSSIRLSIGQGIL
ncbi:hypothetical protein KUH03_20190 [Sphingobacterium sp. E70]|uniref:hypothetical protein n=1 Tax=Sphingobacterium sp. E70 TaxID=2853439 RepID=UPI00211CB021|nr:hypothetical protein [Sphingobacterium sp. E70]ULT28614.1 hypothetical protein KUH03_20190 [Sphingobacterium sp. E70]